MTRTLKYCSFLALMSLTSCLEIELETTLNADGSGEMVMETRSPDQTNMGLLGNSEATTPEELAEEEEEATAKAKKTALKSGVSFVDCAVKLENGFKIESTTITFSDLEKLNLYLNDDSGENGKMLITLTDKGRQKELRQRFTVTKPMDAQSKLMFGSVLAESDVSFTWNFSGDITSASEGAEISENKRSVTWKTSLLDFTDNGVDVTASFEKDSSPNYVGLGLVGLLVLFGGGFLIKGMKK